MAVPVLNVKLGDRKSRAGAAMAAQLLNVQLGDIKSRAGAAMAVPVLNVQLGTIKSRVLDMGAMAAATAAMHRRLLCQRLSMRRTRMAHASPSCVRICVGLVNTRKSSVWKGLGLVGAIKKRATRR